MSDLLNLEPVSDNYRSYSIDIDEKKIKEIVQGSEVKITYSIFSSSFSYNFELAIENSTLILNPLTDKYTFNFCVSIANNFYNFIQGISGDPCGKSQTLQNFANTLGRTVLVWNCHSSENNYSTIYNILKASSQFGYFLVFEELNYLKTEIISSILQTLILIRNAVLDRSLTVNLDEVGVRIDSNFSFFIN